MGTGTSRVRAGVGVTVAVITGILVFSPNAPATAGPMVASTANRARGPKIVAPTITALVSATPTGGSGNDYSDLSSLSSDGRLIAWTDQSSNLGAGDTNGMRDVFVRDMVTDLTERADVGPGGVQANGDATDLPSITRDGRYVAFSSFASNLASGDTNGTQDVFVRDRLGKATERVSVSSAEAQGDKNSWLATITPDGRFVAFMSDATQLVSGDTNGKGDVFVRDRQLGTTTRVSVSNAEVEGNGLSGAPSITPNGRYVAFFSDSSNLVPGDTNAKGDVFRRDLTAGTTVRVSVAQGGAQATGGSSGSDRHPISDDGNVITFASSATNLVAGDTNAVGDIFRRNLSGGTTTRLNLGPGGVQANGASYRPGESTNGDVVVFQSAATNLVSGDTNSSSDIFTRTVSAGTTARQSVATNGAQLGNGAFGGSMSSDGSAVTFVSESGDVVATPAGAGTEFVRKRLPVAPFVTVGTFVAQQAMDFGTGASAAQQQADVTKILSGFPSYQRFVADLARASGWSAKRAPAIRLYWAFFLREPDTGGINYWIGRLQAGKTLSSVAQFFAKSPEFKSKYGSLNDSDFVKLVYVNVLSRQADAAGLAHWVAKLDGGMSRGGMMIQFSESSEGKRKLGPQTDVVLLSLAMLRKVPAASDFTAWRAGITGGGSMEDVVTKVMATPAYAARITP
jgi:Tol biopolymer transport system component